MTPSIRKEIYLNKIATGEGAVPTPATREEMYLAKIAGEEVEVPTPATRVEMYLYKIGGGEIIVPTPATRLEMFLAAASGMPVSTPAPATREEMLWDYIINGTNPQTITGVPPISFTANGTPIISWSMKGNGQQTGTPTHDNPVMPTFCGVRTGNLFDPNSTRYHMGKASNNTIGNAPNAAMFYIKADADMTYTIKVHTSDSTFVRLYLSDAPIVDGVVETYSVISESETLENPEVSITNTNYAYLWIQVGGTWYTEHGGASIMLNSGSIALPYEPFGWAEKITCAGQTVPVYLGQTQTVRKIRKLVLTGDELWQKSGAYKGSFYAQVITNYLSLTYEAYCSHAAHVPTLSQYTKGTMVFNGGTIGNCNLWFNQFDENTTVADFKAYLAAQYATGTPVTVWYILAEPETAIANEPLCKIGDYADELSSTDAGVSIPTAKGSNTLTVESELQPSEMNITGYIAESQTMTAAKIMARASGMNVNDKELESLSKKELNSILKGTVKSDGRSTRSNG